MKQKVVSIVLSLALLFLLASDGMRLSVNAIIPGEDAVVAEEKVYCNATLDDAFADDEILITVYPEWNNKAYSIRDFSDIDCISVEELFNSDNPRKPSRILKIVLEKQSKQYVLDAIRILEEREDIYVAEPNYICNFAMEPDDPECVEGDQWAVGKMNLNSAWNLTTGSPNVIVGVIDSGIEGTHPDLMNRINTELSRSFSPDYSDPLVDIIGHGTSVAGIIGAEGNNSMGVVGVCWDVRLVSLRVDNAKGKFDSGAVVDAIEYAEENGIPILNYSGGGNSVNNTMKVAISEYSGLFVCAAGNEYADNDSVGHYPSNYDLDNIIAVGASTSSDRKRSTSNYGAETVDIFAPGQGIVTTKIGGSYGSRNGTSMAAPHVAGVAALLLSKYPNMTTAEIKNAIMAHVDVVIDTEGNDVFGNLCVAGGRLNAYKSLNHSFRIENDGNLYTHKYACTVCDYVNSRQPHIWKTLSSGYECKTCGMFTTIIPTIPLDLPPNLNLLSTQAINNGITGILMEENTYLCHADGKYFLVKANSLAEAINIVEAHIICDAV